MSGHGYGAGLLWWAATYGLVAAATVTLLRGSLAGLRGTPRAVAAGVVFLAGLIAAHVVPLALGVLARGTVVAAAAVVFGVALLAGRRGVAAIAAPPADAPPDDVASRVLAAIGVAAVAAVWVVALAREAAHPVVALDTLTFHLPNVARWIQHATLWRVDQFIPGLAQGNYPQNGDVVALSAVLPWRDVFGVRVAMALAYAFTGLSVFALARELGARGADAALAAALVLAVPIVALAAVRKAMPDPVMYATFAAGLLFLARHARAGAGADLVLAGVALGLAFGTKWYAVSAVVVVAGVWALARLVARERLAVVLRQAGVVAGLVALAGGVWLVRNIVESGNPTFPQPIAPLGITLFDAPPDPIRAAAGFTVADYLFDAGVWRHYLVPVYRAFLGAPAALLLAGLLAVAGAAVVRRPVVPARVAVLAAAGLVLVAAYTATPYSAFGPRGQPFFAGVNSRYLIPALIVAAAVGAWGAGRVGRAGVALRALAVLAVVLGLRRGYDVPAGAVVLVGAGLVAVWWWRPAVPRAAVVGLLLVAAVALGARVKDRFDARGYRGAEPTVDWVLDHAPAGARIGLAGIFDPAAPAPVLPVFGPRLGNDVRYVGRWERHRLEQFRTPAGFAEALRTGRYDLLLVGRGAPPAAVVPAERWAAAAGWRPVVRDGAMTLLAPTSRSP